MSAPVLKFAVYYGTITLDNGTPATFTASQIATLYNVADQPYLAVNMALPEPFKNGPEYMSYVHLKPLPDAQYYDAKERYNFAGGTYYDEDFMQNEGGKWAVPPRLIEDEQID